MLPVHSFYPTSNVFDATKIYLLANIRCQICYKGPAAGIIVYDQSILTIQFNLQHVDLVISVWAIEFSNIKIHGFICILNQDQENYTVNNHLCIKYIHVVGVGCVRCAFFQNLPRVLSAHEFGNNLSYQILIILTHNTK